MQVNLIDRCRANGGSKYSRAFLIRPRALEKQLSCLYNLCDIGDYSEAIKTLKEERGSLKKNQNGFCMLCERGCDTCVVVFGSFKSF